MNKQDNVVLIYQGGIAKGIFGKVTSEVVEAYKGYLDSVEKEEDTLTEGSYFLVPMDKGVWETLHATKYDKMSFDEYTYHEKEGKYGEVLKRDDLSESFVAYVYTLMDELDDSLPVKDILTAIGVEGALFSPSEFRKVKAYADDKGDKNTENWLKAVVLWDKYVSKADMLTSMVTVFGFKDGVTVSYDTDILLDMVETYCAGQADETDTEYGVVHSLISNLLLVEVKDIGGGEYSLDALSNALHTSVLRSY